MTTEAQSRALGHSLDETLREGSGVSGAHQHGPVSPGSASEVCSQPQDFYQPRGKDGLFSSLHKHFPSVKTWVGGGGGLGSFSQKQAALSKYQKLPRNSSIYVKCPEECKSMAIYRDRK